ncbi:NAD(P)/FAD-dependent oxidoreductase [Salinibacterium sp. ZJ454]|uniref:flavin monoamine oxidase family protein n=1 Tax=Salinibacterium sp. ZJ454 TaxID=2708339 RepID=UPI00142037BB|nr:NAD(P)/FAD-dependent oxidoreductase [Salinibacterium sp. ZJ454]
MDRRTFLIASASSLAIAGLVGCTDQRPPTPSPTATASPTPALVPTPAAFRRTAWSTDPFSRGAASFYATGSNPDDRATLQTAVEDRLFFSGEAVSANPGTVTGAIGSGRAAAQQVADLAAVGERIGVIGAGAAGLAAARALADAGFEVVVIEARDRIGGRIATYESDDWPFPIELGASFLQNGTGDPLVEELKNGGLTVRALPETVETRAPDGAVVEQSPVPAEVVAEAVAWAAAGRRDVSVDTAIADSGAGEVSTTGAISEADWLAQYLQTQLAADVGAPADELSAWYGVSEQAGDGQIALGGMMAVLEREAEGLDVVTSSVVTRIVHTDAGVSMRLATGQSLTVDRVIITAPLGVLKSSALEFDPPLPFGHRAAIDALGMGALEKVWLRFDEPFWQATTALWRTVGTETDFAMWVNLQPFTGDPVLMGIATGDAARRVAELTDDDVLRGALLSLEPFARP